MFLERKFSCRMPSLARKCSVYLVLVHTFQWIITCYFLCFSTILTGRLICMHSTQMDDHQQDTTGIASGWKKKMIVRWCIIFQYCFPISYFPSTSTSGCGNVILSMSSEICLIENTESSFKNCGFSGIFRNFKILLAVNLFNKFC